MFALCTVTEQFTYKIAPILLNRLTYYSNSDVTIALCVLQVFFRGAGAAAAVGSTQRSATAASAPHHGRAAG